MHASLRTAVLSFVLLSTASAVQLANFQTLTISNAQCRAAYTTNIEGCQSTDFEPQDTARCTEACVAGLKKIGEVVKRVCKDVDLGDASIIGVFKLDIGVRSLCPRVDAAASSSAKPPASTSAQPPPASSRAASSAVASSASTLVTSSSTSTSTSTPASSSQSDAAQSSSTSSQGLLVDPSPTSIAVGTPTNVAPPPASSTSAAGPSRAPNAQLSNADSGGGSPFDVQAVAGASSQLRVMDLTMVAFVGTALLFGACG